MEVGGPRTMKGFACPAKEVTILSTLTLHSAKKPVQEGWGGRRKRNQILDPKKSPHITGIASGFRPLKTALQFWGKGVPTLHEQAVSFLS